VERVAFLIEETNERIGCLLNPETLVMRRVAGVQPRRSATGQLTGAGLADDPLLYTGGGRTELELDLLFDVSLAGSSITTSDVRDLTLPLWNLAENTSQDAGYACPPQVLFIWGKSWNIRGVVVAVAERLEYFTSEGVPRRSWLRLRMLRAAEPPADAAQARLGPPPLVSSSEELRIPESGVEVHEVIGGGAPSPAPAAGPTDGTVTASDVVATALAETHAGRSLAAAQATIASAAHSIESELAEWVASEDDAPPAAAEAVAAEVDTIFSALAAVDSAADIDLVGTVISAAATVRAAARRIGDQVSDLASEAGQFIAGKIDAALETIEPAVEGMLSAAQTVIAAVEDRVAVVIAGAVVEMEWAADAIEASLQPVLAVASEVGAGAVERIRGAVEEVDTVVRTIRETGETVAREMLPDALAAIASDLEVLWSVGEFAAAETIGGAVERLSFAFKNVSSATEAVAAVLTTQIEAVMSSAVPSARAALEQLQTEEDPAAVAAVREAVDHIAATVAARPGPRVEAEGPAPGPAAMETLRVAVERLETDERADAAEEATAALETVVDALEAAVVTEGEAAAALVRAAVEAERPSAPPRGETPQRPPEGLPAEEEVTPPQTAPVPEVPPPLLPSEPDRPGARGGGGERLDLLAYRYYRDPALWRLLAVFNDIDDPLALASGRLLRVPPASVLGGS
jgi:hypothetical protein